jgi:hypothetical protein
MTFDPEVELINWHATHFEAAARQGSENGPYQIQKFDEPEEWTMPHGFTPPELESDDQAITALRFSYEQGQPHALAAVAFLRMACRQEYDWWRMDDWGVDG